VDSHLSQFLPAAKDSGVSLRLFYEQEQMIMQVASGETGREEFTEWLKKRISKLKGR